MHTFCAHYHHFILSVHSLQLSMQAHHIAGFSLLCTAQLSAASSASSSAAAVVAQQGNSSQTNFKPNQSHICNNLHTPLTRTTICYVVHGSTGNSDAVIGTSVLMERSVQIRTRFISVWILLKSMRFISTCDTNPNCLYPSHIILPQGFIWISVD